MDQQVLVKIAGDAGFWRQCYGKAYLTAKELGPKDDIEPKPAIKIDYRAVNGAAVKRHECRKAIQILNMQPLYPAGWTINKEGRWELIFHSTP